MKQRIEAACGSHMGRVRSNNEDNFLFDGRHLPQQNSGQLPPLYKLGEADWMAVFDGMGGGDDGEVASFTAAARLKELMQEPAPSEQAADWLSEIARQLNQAVWQVQQGREVHMMGTTMAALCPAGDALYAVNVGDSRIFGLRGERFIQISRDHTDEQYLKENGITGRKPRLSQYLGMDPEYLLLEPAVQRVEVLPGDVYLICSDGLTDMVDEAEISRILRTAGTAPACVQQLIDAALAGGGRDNVTVLVCRILESIKTQGERYGTVKRDTAVEGLAGNGLPWGRKLWQGIQDAAKSAGWKR